ncbi:MAG: carboxypeptidase-like regulatory domain-containing protein [Acidobacteriota bacterium]|nr:carboxypeptidase-like regulatory domain-containing protein [Acidobacteriota bacterium]
MSTPLQNGSSISFSFLFGIEQTGNYRIAINIEALPSGDSSQTWVITGNTENTSDIEACTGPTAATVTIGGRVLATNGRVVWNARVLLTYSNGETRAAVTNSFGYYQFKDVTTGQTYVLSVSHKRYNFDPQVLTLNEDVREINFPAHEEMRKQAGIREFNGRRIK